MDSQYSRQDSEHGNADEVCQVANKMPPRGPSFIVEEDKLLISAWLNTGMDSIQGNDQKLQTFWGKITEYYHQYKSFDNDRSQPMLTQRWGKIQKMVNKFSGCFAAINERHESGKTEQDKFLLSSDCRWKEDIEAQEKLWFNLDHAWILLRHQPKWIQLMQELDSKKSKQRSKSCITNISSSSTTGPLIDIEEDTNTCFPVSRPPGKKAEKRKLKETTDQLVQIQKLHQEKKERDEKKLEIMKEKVEVDQEKVEVDKEKLRVRKLEAENRKFEAEMRIMSMDTSTMNPEQRAYYSKFQMKILQGDI
ncbi:glutathione S-transferase T3-like [Rosa rugosa]|uniref:glutathione S-transferase T3-like n=1 Tax=Rosa rugosa TaxID=74645 RepID=UPI002B404F7B|nr:glutathione S-transferase T3-like [Rosa rugosa]